QPCAQHAGPALEDVEEAPDRVHADARALRGEWIVRGQREAGVDVALELEGRVVEQTVARGRPAPGAADVVARERVRRGRGLQLERVVVDAGGDRARAAV